MQACNSEEEPTEEHQDNVEVEPIRCRSKARRPKGMRQEINLLLLLSLLSNKVRVLPKKITSFSSKVHFFNGGKFSAVYIIISGHFRFEVDRK